ncbi:mastermind-like domain-containing protein 1 [Ochlerotatus camptorhynchus]|uniref:mastermind-like domain-containing protein 1 n=1 Tax=Ochlerotatus camptorhynchus TaxID=644619 RepID=UPI0031DA65BA
MMFRLTILACLAISSATAEPGLEHASFGYGAHMFGGINPELYTTARAIAPLQYGSSGPMVYAGQLYASPMHKTFRPMGSAPLQYAASLPVSYAAPASLAYSSPYASHPHAHMSYGGHTSLAASYAAAAPPTTPFHNPSQYASYAAAPVHTGHVLGSTGASSPSSLDYAAALANSQAYGGSSAYAQQQHFQQQYHQQQQQQQQQHQQQHQQQQSYQQLLDAAYGRSASELYSRGVPFAYPSQVAASSAGQEVARQVAVQLSSGYHQQPAASAFGEARAHARSDSQ